MEITETTDQEHGRLLIEPTYSMPFMVPGIRFNPTRQELVLYLQRKINGLILFPPTITGVLSDCNHVYGEESDKNEPWNVFDVGKTERDCFIVYTQLKNVSPKSKRINRKAGIGNWLGRTAPSDVVDCEGNLIGFNRYFTFDVKGLGKEDAEALRMKHGHWTMHEFSLPDRQSPGDLVLCVIGCNTVISIADDRNSSIRFAKHFYGDRQCNTTDNTSSSPHSNLGLLSKKRRIPGPSQQTARKIARNSGYNASSVDSAAAGLTVHADGSCFSSSNQYSTTACNSQNQDFSSMSHNVGFVDSSQNLFEQQPMVMDPFFSGSEDGYDHLFWDLPNFQQMLQNNDDDVLVYSHDVLEPIAMQFASECSPLKEQNPCFSGFENETPLGSTAFSTSTGAAEKGKKEGHQLL